MYVSVNDLIFQLGYKTASSAHLAQSTTENMQIRAATAGKADKVSSLPRFWVSIRSYKKQPVKKNWGRVLGLSWLKLAVAFLNDVSFESLRVMILEVFNSDEPELEFSGSSRAEL